MRSDRELAYPGGVCTDCGAAIDRRAARCHPCAGALQTGATRAAVRALAAAGLPLRELAARAGVSRQRVARLLRAEPALLERWRAAGGKGTRGPGA